MKVKELLEHGIIELWPNGVIPYRLSEQFTKKEKADVETAIQIIEQVKTLEFRRECLNKKNVKLHTFGPDVPKSVKPINIFFQTYTD